MNLLSFSLGVLSHRLLGTVASLILMIIIISDINIINFNPINQLQNNQIQNNHILEYGKSLIYNVTEYIININKQKI